MARDARSFGRGKPRFAPEPTVLVICEDSKSSRDYLQDATVHFRCNITVKVTHYDSAPKSIVEAALNHQSKYERIYCVLDRDSHETFDEALTLASSCSKIKVIASYPCYEFWLLLHCSSSRKPYVAAGKKSPADCLIADLCKIGKFAHYNKASSRGLFKDLLEDLPVARANSPKIFQQAITEGNMNPSTELHLLIDVFESLASPQPLQET